MICFDTDVLAIHHIFKWDKRFEINEKAFNHVRKTGLACTTIHNVLELCGLFALACQPYDVDQLFTTYLRSKDIKILFPPDVPRDWGEFASVVLNRIKSRMPYGGALIAEVVEQHPVQVFLTWNVKHFRGKIRAKVLTPEEYLKKLTK
ncbi:MAG: hypothetical protein ACTSXJ_10980 [Candidatus Baldrarchaeia archaeon]